MVLFGLLLHPQGMVWVRDPLNLGPSHGGTPLERGIEWAIGVPDTTDRSANKVHRAYLRAWGGARQPDRPGQKPVQSRHKTRGTREFEDYILSRRKVGLSPWAITQDAEANRLYRLARDDPDAELTVQVVRRVLRKDGSSENSP